MEVVSTASRDQSGAAKCGQQQKKLVFLAIVCFLCHNYWEDRRAFPRSLRMEGLMNYGGPKHYSELPNIRREASSSDNYLSSSEDSDSDDEAAEILDLIPTDSTAFKQLLASKIIDSPVSQSESLERLRLLERALRSEENEGQMYKKVVDRILSRRQHHGEKSNLAAASSTSNRTSKMMKCSSKLVKGDYKIARMAAVLASAMNIYSLRCRFAPAAVKDNVLSKFEYTMQLLACTIPGEACVLELGVGSGAVAFVLDRLLQDPSLHLGIDPFPDVYGEPGHFFTKKLLPRTSMHFAPGILYSRSCSNESTTTTTTQSIREGEEEMEPCQVRKHSLRACEQTVGEKFTAIVVDCRGAFPQIISEHHGLLKYTQWILIKHDHGEEAAAELNAKFRANGFVRTVGMPTEGWGYKADRNVFFIEVWEKAVQTTNAMCHRKNELLTTAETAADKLNFYSASSNERQVEMKNKAPSTINMTEEIERANERKEGIQQIDGGFQEQDDAAAGRRWFSRTRSQL
mmetsp:Transcript_40268/g.64708  ORF Transcript_40268/g.64708 Transcript_40268/m.64708 type:complete len:515 (+) Transcript_40268:468-2012(+)